MTRNRLILAALLAGTGLPAAALEIDPMVAPEINLGGRLIATAAAARTETPAGDTDGHSAMDVADSSLLFGFSKYLFDSRSYGFAVLGIKLPEDSSEVEGNVFIHEAHVGVGGKHWETKLGRSQLGNTLLAFPTLRHDDLLSYTHVGNGSSNAEAEEYQIYGNLAQLRYWPVPTIGFDAAVTARTETDTTGARVTGEDFNGFRAGLAYDVPEAIKFARGLRYAAVRVDSQRLPDIGPGLPKDRSHAVIAALALNLSDNPEATWNLDLQGIANAGAPVTALASEAERARAESTAAVVALRYGHRPALQTRWQAAVTVAWKEYRDFTDATAVAVVPSYGYRLGSGVELVAQYHYTRYDGALAQALDTDTEQRLQLGLTFAFDHTFNETVGERQSILNLEHGMFDIGPMGGGH